MYKKEITITREEFHDTLTKVLIDLINTPFDVPKFAVIGIKAEMEFFRKEDDDTDTEAPFKYGDKVFVIDNEGDGNHFVNRVVTIVKVYDYDSCEVTDGTHEQTIDFKNLRKVKTS